MTVFHQRYLDLTVAPLPLIFFSYVICILWPLDGASLPVLLLFVQFGVPGASFIYLPLNDMTVEDCVNSFCN